MLGCRILQASTLYMHAPCNQTIVSHAFTVRTRGGTLTHPVVSQAEKYWRQPFVPVMNSRQLAEFVVLDVDVVGRPNGRYVLADVQVRMTHITAMRQSVM